MKVEKDDLQDWFANIRGGYVTLPRFQRFEAWGKDQIRGVLRNILRQPRLPIGTLLLLDVGDKELFESRPISGAPESTKTAKMNILDGQQRMTAIWRAFTGNYENKQDIAHQKDDFVVFVSLENQKHPEIEIVGRFAKINTKETEINMKKDSPKRMPLWVDSPLEVYKRKLFPITLLCPGSNGEQAMNDWINEAKADNSTFQFIANLRAHVANYPIPYILLPFDTEKETALDVFINMNTSASPLKDFDIVVAQYEEAFDDSLHEKIKSLTKQIKGIKKYGKIEDMVLAIGALLNDKPPSKRTYLEKDFGREIGNVWHEIERGLTESIAFLRQQGIFNESMLPTDIILYLTSALWAKVSKKDDKGYATQLIRKVVWRAGFTDRYSKSTTNRVFDDYKAVLGLLNGAIPDPKPEIFDDKQHPLPEKDELVNGHWPSRKDRLGRAILATSLLKGGYDFADESPANAKNVKSRELHHLFPKKWLQDRKTPEILINSALNCALISWETNRAISAKEPKKYIEERAKNAKASEEQVRRRLESHLVPYDELIKGDYTAFLDARAEKIHSLMKILCQGELPE